MANRLTRDDILKVFPSGYHAAPGILTVGGYRCVSVNAENSVWCGNGVVTINALGDNSSTLNDELFNQKEFLPSFSFDDKPTWVQLMTYLGGMNTPTQEESEYLDWCFAWIEPHGVLKDPCWALIGHSSGAYPAGPMLLFPDILASNIEEALFEAIVSSQNKAKAQ